MSGGSWRRALGSLVPALRSRLGLASCGRATQGLRWLPSPAPAREQSIVASMKPALDPAVLVYGVHKDLTGGQIDDRTTVIDAYEFVAALGDAFKQSHPELVFLADEVVDIVFVHPLTGEGLQRVEWQAHAKERSDAAR